MRWRRDGSVAIHSETRILDSEYDSGKTELCMSLDEIELFLNIQGYVQTGRHIFKILKKARRKRGYRGYMDGIPQQNIGIRYHIYMNIMQMQYEAVLAHCESPRNKADGPESSRLWSTWMKSKIFLNSTSCCLALNHRVIQRGKAATKLIRTHELMKMERGISRKTGNAGKQDGLRAIPEMN